MIKIIDKGQCCGCSACMSVCPKDAITMQPDNMGFLYPSVDESKCIECGLCEKVCSFNANYKAPYCNEPLIYAARHKNKEEVAKSQSGGLFYSIAQQILTRGGVVYGVVLDKNLSACHMRISDVDDFDRLRGSKYVQSDLKNTFSEAIKDLKDDKVVLFSGTPCQISGFLSLVRLKNINEKNLYTCSIVCHGVPAPKIWQDNLKYIEGKLGERIVRVNFRDKKYGWHSHKETYVLSNNKSYTSDLYTNLFYQHIILRESCSVCYFTNFRRPSDITIADYWGVEKIAPLWNNENTGVSLVIISTEKGASIYKEIQKNIEYIESNKEQCLQPNLQHPSKLSPKTTEFKSDYVKEGFAYVAKKYGNIGWNYKINKIVDFLNRSIYRLKTKI